MPRARQHRRPPRRRDTRLIHTFAGAVISAAMRALLVWLLQHLNHLHI